MSSFTSHSDTDAARFRTFSCIVLTTVIGLCATTVFANLSINLYGLYGDVRGRNLVPAQSERRFKYMYSYNYIPSNFDGVLVGTSITDNWETAGIHGFRVYNASIVGAGIADEAPILQNVLHRGRLNLVLFVIHPYLTQSYQPKVPTEIEREYWGGLGSLQLFKEYYVKWKIDRGVLRQEFSPNGCFDYDPPQRLPAAVANYAADAAFEFEVDERAVKQYANLVASARNAGVQVVGIIPPVEADVWRRRGPAYERAFNRLKPLFSADEPIIDLNGPDLAVFRSEKRTFSDGTHLSREAAVEAVAFMDRELRRLGLDSETVKPMNKPVPGE
jgi:hypothetical protein